MTAISHPLQCTDPGLGRAMLARDRRDRRTPPFIPARVTSTWP